MQNFYDAIGWEKWAKEIDYSIENNSLTLRAKNVGFSYDWLLHIGASTKRAGKHAGYFGEGFKIASLCALRDHGWSVSMASRNWTLKVCTSQVKVDDTSLSSLAYEIERSSEAISETVLHLAPFSDSDLLEAVMLSFYFPENPLFGECLWQSAEGAVFTRSSKSKPPQFPQTYDDSGQGIVYAGFQAMGSFREPLVFCLHSHRNDDRDRGTYFRMQVVGLIEQCVSLLPPESSARVLGALKSRWYELPRKKYDFDCYSKIVRRLVANMSRSEEVTASWRTSHPNLLVAHPIRRSDIASLNRRRQARDWLKHSSVRYRLVQDGFALLSYQTLETVCEMNDGFSVVREPDEDENRQIKKLEAIMARILDDLPLAVWRGMAVCIPIASSAIKFRGFPVRFRLPYIAMQRSLLLSAKPNIALGTYLHELAHVFGGDRSASFSRGLSEFLDAVLAGTNLIGLWQSDW